jgi:hypothetical protein
MTGNGAFGQNLDDPDELFRWVHRVVMGVATINLVNRAGVTTRLLQGPAALAELAELARVPADKLARLLDYLLAHEVLERMPDGNYHATARTRMLHAAAGYFVNAETSTMAASQLLTGLREGRSGFEAQFGQPVRYRANISASVFFTSSCF